MDQFSLTAPHTVIVLCLKMETYPWVTSYDYNLDWVTSILRYCQYHR